MPLQVQKTVGFARSKSSVFGPVWEHRQYLRLYCIARKGYAGVAASAAVHALNAVSGVVLLLLVGVNKKTAATRGGLQQFEDTRNAPAWCPVTSG